MKPLALAVAALALAAQASAQANEPPHRCNVEKMSAAVKKLTENKLPDGHADYMRDIGVNSKFWVINEGSELLCDKAVWAFLAQAKNLKPSYDSRKAHEQLQILIALDAVFQENDKKAYAVFAAADAVYDAAQSLKIAAAAPSSLAAQLGLTENKEKPNVYDKASARSVTLVQPKKSDKAVEGAAALQASLVIAGGEADKPKAGALVKAFNKAVEDWYVRLAKMQSEQIILKKHAPSAGTKIKDLDVIFNFSVTGTKEDIEAMSRMSQLFKALVDVKATVDGKKWKEDGAQPAAVLSKIDIALRSALGMHISQVDAINKLAVAVDPNATGESEVTPNPGGTVAGPVGVTGDMEKQVKAKAVSDANLAQWFDGQTPKDPGVLPTGADDVAKDKHEKQVTAWQRYQAIQSGKLVEVQDATGKKSKQFQVGGKVLDVKDGETADQIGSRVAQLILGGDVAAAQNQAVLDSFITPGGVPNLSASGVMGSGTATGLKSDRPSCGADKLTQSDYEKKLEQEKKKATAGRSADRQEAQRDYLSALDDAKKELEECSSYGDAKRRIKKSPTEVAACQKTHDAKVAAAEKKYKAAVEKYGTADEIAVDDAAAGNAAKVEADKKLRSFVMKVIDLKRGNWRALPENALAFAKDSAARQWAKDHKPAELVAAYFKDQWPRNGSKYSVEEANPDNVNYKANLDACMAKGMRTSDDERVVSQCIGPSFTLWLEGQIEASAKGEYNTGAAGPDAAKKAECEVAQEKIKKNKKGTLSEECKKILGVK